MAEKTSRNLSGFMKNPIFIGISALIVIGLLVLLCILFIPLLFQNSFVREGVRLYNGYRLFEAIEYLMQGIDEYPLDENIKYLFMKTVNTSLVLDFPAYYPASLSDTVREIIENSGETKNVRLITEIGCFHRLNNDPAKAVECFEKAIKIDPGYYPPYNYLGNSCLTADNNKAVEYYKKLFSLNPDVLDFKGVEINDALPYLPGEIAKRRNLKTLLLSGMNIPLLQEIAKMKSLSVLYLSNKNFTQDHLFVLNNLKKLKLLCLSSKSITTMEGFGNLTELRVLHLNNTQINRIENLEYCTKLHDLDLSSNKISRIENLDKLSRLQKLFLRHNPIEKIENLDGCTGLTILDLYDTRIARIGNLDKMKNLSILDLYFNQVAKLENLDALSNLRRLYVRGNKINKLENLDSLSRLEILDLYENRIEKLENLEALTNLKSLVLFGNSIDKIENLDALTHLEELDLRKNRISRVGNLDVLKNLKVLYLSYNDIRKIENLDALVNLETLYMSAAQIHKIENLDNMVKLKNLYLGNAGIEKIENLDALKELQMLYLSGNNIAKLENLSSLVNLEAINLDNNFIRKIENLDQLVKLRGLYLNNNRIPAIENLERLTNLEYLYLAFNRIGAPGYKTLEIPESFSNMKVLVIKGPSYMLPGNIQYIKGIENLKNIEKFEFAYQNLVEMPDFSGPATLRSLLIEKCVHLKKVDFTLLPASLNSLTLWNVNLKNIEGIERLAALEELWIGGNRELTSLSGLGKVSSLKSLNITLCEKLPAEEILKLDNLKTLYLTADQYPQEVLDQLRAKGIRIET